MVNAVEKEHDTRQNHRNDANELTDQKNHVCKLKD